MTAETATSLKVIEAIPKLICDEQEAIVDKKNRCDATKAIFLGNFSSECILNKL